MQKRKVSKLLRYYECYSELVISRRPCLFPLDDDPDFHLHLRSHYPLSFLPPTLVTSNALTELVFVEWKDAYNHLRTVLGLPTDEPIPPIPRPARQVATISIDDASTGPPETKRKAPDEDGDVEMPADSSTEVSKRAKTDGAPPPTGVSNPSSDEAMLAHAKRTAAYIPILSPEILLPPKLPTREEMEAYLLELRKKALVEEYFGDEQ